MTAARIQNDAALMNATLNEYEANRTGLAEPTLVFTEPILIRLYCIRTMDIADGKHCRFPGP